VNSTKTKILKAGIKIWKKNPDDVKALTIAKEIGMVHATMLYHFPEVVNGAKTGGVKNAVASYAVEIGEASSPRVVRRRFRPFPCLLNLQ